MFNAINPLSTITVVDISNSELQPEFVIPPWIHCALKVWLIAASKADSRMQYPLHAPAHLMCVHVSNCCAAIGCLGTGHSCSLVTIALNAIRVYVFGKVVTTTNVTLCIVLFEAMSLHQGATLHCMYVLTRTSTAYVYRLHEDGSSKETEVCSPHDPTPGILTSSVVVSESWQTCLYCTYSLGLVPTVALVTCLFTKDM